MKLLPASEWREGMEGLFLDLPAEKYHAAPGVSHSMLKNCEPPARLPVYMTEKHEPSVAMIMGTCVHSRILEPDKPLPHIVVKPEGMQFRSTVDKKWRDNHIAAGNCILKQEEFDALGGMIGAIKDQPWCEKVFAHPGGKSEVSGFVKKDGILRKSRWDFIPSGNFLCDIKTYGLEASNENIERTLYVDNHFTQAAYYLDNWNLLNPDDQRHVFIFIYVEKSPPYLIKLWQMDDRDIELGRNRNEINLQSIDKASRDKFYPGFPLEPKIGRMVAWGRHREGESKNQEWLGNQGFDH